MDLILLFPRKNNAFEFVGWAANEAKLQGSKIGNNGIGVGSTRKEMESAYVIKVVKTLTKV
jgi:hypothetical protein